MPSPTTHSRMAQPAGLYVQPQRDRPNSSTQPLVFPLKHTAVTAKVTGNLARVEVVHQFENPFTTPLEATYIFPLPDEAAVDEMEIRLGDRTLHGTIKKRQEAQQIYAQAKQRGQTAGLLEQERANIFTQSLANIRPGEQICVTIRYSESLRFEGGDYEFVFPMVVGPRYIPGISLEDGTMNAGSASHPMTLNQNTDQVPDASRLNAPVLPPEMRSGHDIAVTLEIAAGVEVQDVRSPSHQLQVEQQDSLYRVTLAPHDTLPNKDLIVRYQIMGDRLQSTVLTHTDERGAHLAVYLIPALQHQPRDVVPKEIVFLIDTSGSQMGDPLFKCQELMRRFVMGLNPHDTFNIMDFANTTQRLSPVPLENTEANRYHAMRYINQLTAGGGTYMLGGIREVLSLPVIDPHRVRNIVLLTDGYIGNETQIFAEVQQRLRGGVGLPGHSSPRLFSFGAGSSVNRFLLNRIAEIGRGVCRVVRQDEPTEEVAEKFFRQINNPVLTNIQLSWQGAGEPPEFYPNPLPDLFAEQPLVVFGRKVDAEPGYLGIAGMAAGGQFYQQVFDLDFTGASSQAREESETGVNVAIAQLWGRARIKSLMNQMVSSEVRQGVEAVTETALSYQLLSQYTAFVAVSEDVRVSPEVGSVSVQVPVEIPEGVSHAGVFRTASPPRAMADPMAQMAAQPEAMGARSAPRARKAETVGISYSELIADFPEEALRPQLSADSVPRSTSSESFLCSLPPSDRGYSSPPPNRPERPLKVSISSARGLDKSLAASLQRHLQSTPLFDNQYGGNESVYLSFKFELKDAKVANLVQSEQNSSVVATSSLIRQLMILIRKWQPDYQPQTLFRQRVRVVLQLQIDVV